MNPTRPHRHLSPKVCRRPGLELSNAFSTTRRHSPYWQGLL